jgi:hypothetical protein
MSCTLDDLDFDPTNNVLLVAEDAADFLNNRLIALLMLLRSNEPSSSFAIARERETYENFGRLRVLRRENGDDDISKDCAHYFNAYVYFHSRGLPIAYHTLILTTTAG